MNFYVSYIRFLTQQALGGTLACVSCVVVKLANTKYKDSIPLPFAYYNVITR
jgi:hypothetical protein